MDLPSSVIHAHCSDEFNSDSKKIRWRSDQKKLCLDAIDKTGALKAACLRQVKA